MGLLPFESFSFTSPLQIQEALDILNKNIAPNKTLGITFNNNSFKEYEGYINYKTHKFNIRRILKAGRNSFVPIAQGSITNSNEGSFVHVKIRLHKIVNLMIVLFLAFCLILFFSSLFSMETSKDELLNEIYQNEYVKDELKIERHQTSKSFNWNGIIMFLAIYLLVIIFYDQESRLIKNELKRMLLHANSNQV